MNADIREWIIINIDYLQELIKPLRDNKAKALTQDDGLFSDEIEKQYKSLVLRLISVEVSKATGCSTESFYDSIEDHMWGELWRKIF